MIPTTAYAPYGSAMVAPVGEVDKVNAFGQVVERDFYGGVPQFAAPAPQFAAPAVYPATTFAQPAYNPYAQTVVGGVAEIDRVNAFGQVVERDFVGAAPRFAAPTVLPTTAAPMAPYSYAPTAMVGGFGEIDKVNAFGQVVERDFIGGVPRAMPAFPATTAYAAPATTAYAAPATTVMSGSYAPPVAPFVSSSYAPPVAAPVFSGSYASPVAYPPVFSGSYAPPVVGGVAEIDRVNAFGQVVERDFVGGVPRYGAPAPYIPTTVAQPAYRPYAPAVVGAVGEVDRVNAFGQVVERDFYGGVPSVYGGVAAPGFVGGAPMATVL